MSDLLPIQELSSNEVRRTTLDILRAERPIETLSTWLSSVDWSGDSDDAELTALLGDLEGLVTDAEEDELSSEEFIREARARVERRHAIRR